MKKKISESSLKWIEDQQNHSWQIEILISGGLVYTLYQLPNHLKRLFILAYENTFVGDHTVAILIGGYFITQTLLIGFAVNLILRAIWVAYLGINFSFPPKPHLKDEATQDKQGMLAWIMNLERLSSLSYSIAIISALMAIGMLVLSLFLMPVIRYILPNYFFERGIFTIGFLVVYIFLFFSIPSWPLPEILKKVKWFTLVWTWVKRLFSLFSLHIIYKKGWSVLTTNIKKWKIYLLQFSYLLLAISLSVNQIGEYYSLFSNLAYSPLDERSYKDIPTRQRAKTYFYEDNLKNNSLVLKVCIQDEFIEENYLKLFAVYWVDFDRTLKYEIDRKNLNIDGGFESLEDLYKNDSLYSDCINGLFDISIDNGTKIENLEWFERSHHLTKEEGFLTFIPLDSLSRGPHKLKLIFNDYFPEEDTIDQQLWEIIPFIKE